MQTNKGCTLIQGTPFIYADYGMILAFGSSGGVVSDL